MLISAAGAGQLHPLEHVGPEDLEAAVDIAQVHLEEQLDHLVEAGADDIAIHRIVALDPVAGHNIIPLDIRRQARDVVDIKLAIRVHKHQIVAGSGGEAGGQRRAIAAVLGVVLRADVRVLGGQLVHDFRRAVMAAIVHRNDFIVAEYGGQHFQRLAHHVLDIRFLVMGR